MPSYCLEDKSDGSFRSVSIKVWNVAPLVAMLVTLPGRLVPDRYLGLPATFLCLVQEATDRKGETELLGLTN